ncbi:MAG: tRNA pseudouridine(13) synthase TruD [Candidatus Lambdaproteobacteria bacterium]|nr:tRNA pseudouridine(13) synthase TruD [Candidatus Lambdaproteobacteria bacterium]
MAPPPLPYALPLDPGCGGRLRARIEDFQVEELAAYEPSGTGEHLYLYVRKRGLPTPGLLERIGRTLGLAPHRIGHAGLKDSQAVTCQWISLHSRSDLPLAAIESEQVQVLRVSRHGNKLRPGHLAGNRFTIVVRGVTPCPDLPRVLDALRREGFPNYYGPQRLGRTGRNVEEGRAFVRGGFRARLPTPRARFVTNAYQAVLFNALVATRLRALGSLAMLLPGDLALLHRNGAVFPVAEADLAAIQARAAAGELSPSAPLYGTRTLLAEGEPGRWEIDLLAAEGLTAASFQAPHQRLTPEGQRRAVRALPDDLTAEPFDDAGEPCLRLAFTLPPGTYATSLLRELMRNDDLVDYVAGVEAAGDGADEGE